jgi:hypothetical protein
MIDCEPAALPTAEEKQRQVAAHLEEAIRRNGGGRAWREWKRRSTEAVLDLVLRSPRMQLLGLSLEGDVEMAFEIRCPVPRWPKGDRLVIGQRVVCHLLYQEHWRFESAPGWAPLGVVWPPDLYHSNVRPYVRSALCLWGFGLPPNTQPKEIVLAAFDAVTLQSINIDESDPAGVLNAAASEFYRRHPEYVPLTRAGLLDPPELDSRR